MYEEEARWGFSRISDRLGPHFGPGNFEVPCNPPHPCPSDMEEENGLNSQLNLDQFTELCMSYIQNCRYY